VAAVVQEVHGKRMAQLMQVEFHLGLARKHLYQVPQAFGFERGVFGAGYPKKWGYKEDFGATALVKIIGQGLANLGIERNSAGQLRFRRFGSHDKPAMGHIDIADFQ